MIMSIDGQMVEASMMSIILVPYFESYNFLSMEYCRCVFLTRFMDTDKILENSNITQLHMFEVKSSYDALA